jgi:hypothetical protein
MILFINKKVIAIYPIIISFFLLFSSSVWSNDDLLSYCFAGNVNLHEVKRELDFLLLPREKVAFRNGDGCIDIVTSNDRGKLLEKFLRKRYTLIAETSSTDSGVSKVMEHCRLEFKTTKQRQVDTKNAAIGVSNQLNAGSNSRAEVSTSQILLGLGKPGSLDVGGQSLEVECRKGATGFYQLIFKQAGAGNSIQSEASLRAGEVLNVGSIAKEINEKNKNIGIPQTSFQNTVGNEVTTYELKIIEEN